MKATLLLRKIGDGPGPYLIRRFTKEDFDHCEIKIEFDDGTVSYLSALLWSGGVRADVEPAKGNYVEIPIGAWRNPEDILEVFYGIQGYRYDILGIFGSYVLGANIHWTQGATCSEACGLMLGFPNTNSMNPAQLGRWTEYLNEVVPLPFKNLWCLPC